MEEEKGWSEGSAPMEPLDITIRERIGEMVLTLNGDKLVVAPSKAFVHAIAERMADAETVLRGRSMFLDRWVAKGRNVAHGRLEQLFGEFSVQDCMVELKDGRLHLRVHKVRTSFGPQAFNLQEAESFVRQFERARAAEE